MTNVCIIFLAGKQYSIHDLVPRDLVDKVRDVFGENWSNAVETSRIDPVKVKGM